MPRVRCLNEAFEGSCRGVFRAWEQRLDFSLPPLESNDDDPELLLHIPFDGDIKVKAISIIGGSDGSSPSQLRAFVNRDDLDFSSVAELPPTQQWDLVSNARGDMEYPVQIAKFNNVHSLDLHFPSNFGADTSRIHFVGIKGEFTAAKREPVIAVYEARPVPQDHTVPGSEMGPFTDVS